MARHSRRANSWSLPPLFLAGALLGASGCSEPQADIPESQAQIQSAEEQPGTVEDLGKLPYVEPEAATDVFLQKLKEPTALGENFALHVKLPEPANPELKDSLVRVIGEPERPLMLFSSDALAELGEIPKSPGSGFYTLLTQHDSTELERRVSNEQLLSSGKMGEVTEQSVLFQGRTPVGISKGISLDLQAIDTGIPVPIRICPSIPASTLQKWGESVFITSPAVVKNPARTWDPCTGAGTQGGVWTFAHLMRQLSLGSGMSAEAFALDWLKLWVNNQTVNGDVVAARTAMFAQVIQPWATASGVTATMTYNNSTGRNDVTLSGPLNLNIAPFRLLAIVNRLDLGGTTRGPSTYGGSTGSVPSDAGELRFIFGVVQPNPWGAGSEATCGAKPFTVIFEYGVPITGCSNVAAWAREWTKLNTYGGFTSSYLTQLQTLTQNVVLYGKAPTKGNRSALNQIRTNENALNWRWWEFREFRLSIENPSLGTDTPANGPLRMHTVAQTANDTSFGSGNAVTDQYTMDKVLLGTPAGTSNPNNCNSSYTVPYSYAGVSFRGGNSLMAPNYWRVNLNNPSNPREICSRHQFSLNSCQGCHKGDTGTAFTHINPQAGIPAPLSGFLTGGGPGSTFNVVDPQLGSPTWRYADLEKRFKRLYDIAYCVQCTRAPIFDVSLPDRMVEITGRLPIDPVSPVKTQFEIGPVHDISQVKKLLEVRSSLVKGFEDQTVDFIQLVDSTGH
ncbi:hypothetical protein JRI60_34400 [Archangium violaceum]|nr:hypothetical protein JRI60_34400 [Archangium violaceum]